MSPHITNSDFGLYKYFRVASSLSINWLKFAEGALYKANIFRLNIICVIKSRQMRWTGHASHMGEKRNAYNILDGKPDGKRLLGRLRLR
jgi:hypothetical protein